jgi:integrase/recombinase XerC
LVDWWDDFARSLRRRGRSDATARIYGQSFERFWRWALPEGLPPDPAAVSTDYVNRWTDSLRDGIAPATVSVYWRNLRPFSSWWAKETDQPNPFRGADVPAAPLEPPDVIDLDDILALLATCTGKDFAARRDNAVIRVLFDPAAGAANSSTSGSATGTDAKTS